MTYFCPNVSGWRLKKQKLLETADCKMGSSRAAWHRRSWGQSASLEFWPWLAFFSTRAAFCCAAQSDFWWCWSVQLYIFAVFVDFIFCGQESQKKSNKQVGGLEVWTRQGINKWKWNGNQRAFTRPNGGTWWDEEKLSDAVLPLKALRRSLEY